MYKGSVMGLGFRVWEFPTIRGTILWGPYNKSPLYEGPLFLETPKSTLEFVFGQLFRTLVAYIL